MKEILAWIVFISVAVGFGFLVVEALLHRRIRYGVGRPIEMRENPVTFIFLAAVYFVFDALIIYGLVRAIFDAVGLVKG